MCYMKIEGEGKKDRKDRKIKMPQNISSEKFLGREFLGENLRKYKRKKNRKRALKIKRISFDKKNSKER